MAYASWSVVFGEQPSAAKWNMLGTNDASFNDGTGIGTNAITGASLATTAITLGYAAITASIGPTAAATADADLTGLSVTVTVPAGGRRIKITGYISDYEQSGGVGTTYGVVKVKESTTVLATAAMNPSAVLPNTWTVISSFVPTAGSHTYKLSHANNGTGPTYTYGASATSPSFILVELI